ncbi:MULTISPECIES: hypothetical protein [Kordiimonas]|jgi:hypothetical protein|uniref:PAS domain-containing protein n=1 Tax=Kordiimonas lacus TaxID=637679 RepID=A0A1G6YSF4_9PROT|nr:MULTISPECIES: hypothetical protein [Kordiimonas]SDD92585.1 hypothetical protein SAMN04488071_1707 [Kordiimonas lacus]
MRQVQDVIFGECADLSRPILAEAYQWVLEHLAADGMVPRSDVSGPKLASFIRHASLFELVIEDGQVQDYHARVLASHIADNIQEISGRTGKDTLPGELFERWRITAQYLIEHRRPFRTQSQVFGKENKNAESLIAPVSEDGELTHALVFTEYWFDQPLFSHET